LWIAPFERAISKLYVLFSAALGVAAVRAAPRAERPTDKLLMAKPPFCGPAYAYQAVNDLEERK
jgi:hypothetical protein